MSDRESFKEWYDAIWLGDNEHGQFIPESNHTDYKEYLQGYTLAHGAWEAATNLKQAEITQLKKQLSEANKYKKDAQRYRKIREVIAHPNGSLLNSNCRFGASIWVRTPQRDGAVHIRHPSNDDLDEAIDQAMQANKQNKQD